MPLCVGHGVADALWSCAKQSSLNFPSFTISLGSNTTNFPSLSSFPSPLVFISPFAFLQLMVTPSPERKKERIVIVRVRFRISNEEYRVLQASIQWYHYCKSSQVHKVFTVHRVQEMSRPHQVYCKQFFSFTFLQEIVFLILTITYLKMHEWSLCYSLCNPRIPQIQQPELSYHQHSRSSLQIITKKQRRLCQKGTHEAPLGSLC